MATPLPGSPHHTYNPLSVEDLFWIQARGAQAWIAAEGIAGMTGYALLAADGQWRSSSAGWEEGPLAARTSYAAGFTSSPGPTSPACTETPW